jgi:POT family proton-dependent oligopeptide transporter
VTPHEERHARGAADAAAEGVTAFERTFKHPPGLAVLFVTEMWERMSYYGMRSLLRLYMANYLFVAARVTYERGQEVRVDGDPSRVLGLAAVRSAVELFTGPLDVSEFASQLYGLYTGLVYLTPLFGGMLADRYLGQRRSVVLGGVLMAIGHFVMAFEDLFFVALTFLILGNGAFKPNVSTQVGDLYPAGDPRRDRAFNIFYVGINAGALLAPLVCGTLGQTLGWHYGFGAAGVGMCVGLVAYLWGQRYLPREVRAARSERVEARATPSGQLTPSERRAIGALVVLCLLNVSFWAVYEQQGNTMQVWADEQTVWPTVFGFTIPSTWFQSFNPFMIIALTPVLNMLWTGQARRGTEPTSVTKMAIGCFVLGASFLVMVAGARVVGEGQGSVFWPFFCTLLLTVGELYLSPIGLSLVTKIAPKRMMSMLMGMWFLSSFVGNLLSGTLGIFYTRMPKEGFFFLLAAIGLATGALMLPLLRPLKKAVGEHV